MYHRVCPRTPETACYFARGTAVEPAVFAAQMRWLAARHPVVPPYAALASPGVMLTFDDGYRDVIEHVAPTCAALGLPVAVFPIAGHLGGDPLCWVDAWYDLLHRARRRAAPGRLPLVSPDDTPPPIDADLRWWVRGPIKERLHALDPAARARALTALAEALDVPPAPARSSLYCTRAELTALRRAGHTLGGHGVRHHRLSRCAPAERDAELRGAMRLLDALEAPAPRVFCYPDGDHDAETVEATARAGFEIAFTVQPGVIEPDADPLRWPRHIVRNHPPTDPRWCEAFRSEDAR